MALTENSHNNMGFSDEDRCTLFRLPIEAYPRYEYFRDILKDFHPRLTKTIEKLPHGLENAEDLQSLDKRIRFLTGSDYLKIQVIGPGNTRIALKQIVDDHTKYENGERRQIVRLADTEGWNDSEANMKPSIAIYTMSSLDISKFVGSERRQWLKNRFQYCNLIFFIRDRKNDKKDDILAFLQRVLLDDFKTHTMRKTVIFQSEQDTITTALSQMLEEMCVKAFVNIERYIASVTKVSNLRGNISITLDELFDDFKIPIQRMLQDEDLFEICIQEANINRGPIVSSFSLYLADRIVILLASKLVPIFKIPGPAIHSFMYASKLREETKDILLNLKDLDIVLETLCKEREKKLCLPLSEGEKGLDEESKESKLKASHTETQQKMANVNAVVDELLTKLKNPIIACIKDIMNAQPAIRTLKRLHFELEGILKETSMHLCTDSEFKEEYSKDPSEGWKQALQKKLKGVNFTTATVFGKLCIFIHDSEMKEPEENVKEKIKKVFSTFPYEYEVKITDVPLQFANGHEVQDSQKNVLGTFKMGMHCRSKGLRGTIGLFLKEKSNENNLFFVTSAHLVPKEGQVVQACTGGNNWVNLGKTRVVIPTYENLIDIAAVEVLEAMSPLCSTEIEDERNRIVRAKVFDAREECSKLEKTRVYKKGAETGVTKGIIASVCGPNHLFVSPTPGSWLSFAEEGDSGAIVCFNTQDRETWLLSMIMGQHNERPKTVLDSETLYLRLPDIQEGAEGGMGQSTDEQLIFTTLLCKGLEELKTKKLDLKF